MLVRVKMVKHTHSTEITIAPLTNQLARLVRSLNADCAHLNLGVYYVLEAVK